MRVSRARRQNTERLDRAAARAPSNKVPSIKTLRDVLGAVLKTYDDVLYWMPTDGGIVVTLSDGRKIEIIARWIPNADAS